MKYTTHRRCKLPVPWLSKRNRLKIRPAGQSEIMENILGLIIPKPSIKERTVHPSRTHDVPDVRGIFFFAHYMPSLFVSPISKHTKTFLHASITNTPPACGAERELRESARFQRRNDAKLKKNLHTSVHGHSLVIHR